VRAIAVVCLMAALAAAVPRPARAARRAPDTLTVVTLNLWNDQGDWPRRLARIVPGLRALHADAICLQEVLQHPGLPNQAGTIADSLGMAWHFVSVDGPERPKRYGNAILTPHRVLVAEGVNLEPANDYRVAAHVRIEFHGRPVDVYDTHLHHTREGGAIRAVQVAHLLRFVDSTRTRAPVVLGGDFNAEITAPEFAPLAARLDDAWRVTHPGAGAVESETLNPAFGYAPTTIDHILVERGTGGLRPVESAILFRDAGPDSVWATDHFGVVAKLLVPGRSRR
jgi:endonuclease/exonuclease/phosphatase family metal-dependent hydrolase